MAGATRKGARRGRGCTAREPWPRAGGLSAARRAARGHGLRDVAMTFTRVAVRLVPAGLSAIASARRLPVPIAGTPDMPDSMPALRNALILLRGTVALIFMAHALVRLVNGSVPQFGAFLESRGFPAGTTLVGLISAWEILGGLLLALGIGVRWVCSGLALIVVMGVVLIHVRLGWFVGEHGTGGMEFSVLLAAALLVVACAHAPDRLAPGRMLGWRQRATSAGGVGPPR